MRIALLLGLVGCVDGATVAPDTRHVDIPRGADRAVEIEAVDSAVSTDDAIASVAIAADGVHVTGVREGDATISIDHAGALTTVVAHVTAPAFLSIAIDPEELVTSVGTVMALRAYATDTTGAVSDVTAIASWRVEDPTIASLVDGSLRGVTAGGTMLHAVLVDAAIDMPVAVR